MNTNYSNCLNKEEYLTSEITKEVKLENLEYHYVPLLRSFENLDNDEKDKLMTDIIEDMPDLLKLYQHDKDNLDLVGKIFIWRIDRFGCELFIGDGAADYPSVPDCIQAAEKWFNNLFNFLELVEKIPNPPTNSWRLINQFCYWHFEEIQESKANRGENLQIRLLTKIKHEGNEVERVSANSALKWHCLLTERVTELIEKKDEELFIHWYRDIKETLEFGQFISHPRLQGTLIKLFTVFPRQVHLMMDLYYDELNQFAKFEHEKIFNFINNFFVSFLQHPNIISENSKNSFFYFSIMRLLNLNYKVINSLDSDNKLKSPTSEILIKLGAEILFSLLNFEEKYEEPVYLETLKALKSFFHVENRLESVKNNFVTMHTKNLLDNYNQIQSSNLKRKKSNSKINNPNFIDSIRLKILNSYHFPMISLCLHLLYSLDLELIGCQQYINLGQDILLRYKDPNLINPAIIHLAFHLIELGIVFNTSTEELKKIDGDLLDLLRLRFYQRFMGKSNANEFNSFNDIINNKIALLSNRTTTQKRKTNSSHRSKLAIEHPPQSVWTSNIPEIFNLEKETYSILNSFVEEKKSIDTPLNINNTLPIYLDNLINKKNCLNKKEVIKKLIAIHPYINNFNSNLHSYIFKLFKQAELDEKKLTLQLLTLYSESSSINFSDFPENELLEYINNDDFYKNDNELETLFLASNPCLLQKFNSMQIKNNYICKLKDCVLMNSDEVIVENMLYRLKILINIFDHIKKGYIFHLIIKSAIQNLFSVFDNEPSLLMNGEMSYYAGLLLNKYILHMDSNHFLFQNNGICCPYLKISDRSESLQINYLQVKANTGPSRIQVEMALVRSLFCNSFVDQFPFENQIFKSELSKNVFKSYFVLREERAIQIKTAIFREEKTRYEADLFKFKLNICNKNIKSNNAKTSALLIDFSAKIDLVYTQTINKSYDLLSESTNRIKPNTTNKNIQRKLKEFKKNLSSLEENFIKEINQNETEFKDKLEEINKEEELINNIDLIKNSVLDGINSNLLPTKLNLETEIESLKNQMEILSNYHATICDLENENSLKIENEVIKIKQMVERNEKVNYKNDFEDSLEIIKQLSAEKIDDINSTFIKKNPKNKKTETLKELKERFHFKKQEFKQQINRELNNNKKLSERIRVLEQELQKTSLQNEIQAEDFSREPIKKVKEKLLSLIRSFSNEEIALIEQESSLLDLNTFEELLENQNGSYMKKDALIEMACSCGILLKVIPGKGNHNNYSHVLKDNSMLNGSGFSISSHGDDVDPNCVKSAIKAMFKVISHYAETIKKLS
jgi:hypothetical protein